MLTCFDMRIEIVSGDGEGVQRAGGLVHAPEVCEHSLVMRRVV